MRILESLSELTNCGHPAASWTDCSIRDATVSSLLPAALLQQAYRGQT